MLDKKRILVFSASYNEKENIQKLILGINKHLPDAEILIIDDNSPDHTKDIIIKIQQNLEKLKLIIRDGKMGLDTAHKYAYQYAVKNNYEYLITMDADLSHDPKELPNFIKYLNLITWTNQKLILVQIKIN